MKFDISISEFVGLILDRFIQPIVTKQEKSMSALTDKVNALTIAVAALVPKVDAMIASNATLSTAAVETQVAIATLQQQLVDAQAGAADAATLAALDALTQSVGDLSAKLG